jgi:V/A-type H+/Na+-transporting ATPase subunit D
LLGLPLAEARVDAGQPESSAPTVAASPEADACRAAFAALIPCAVRLAAMVANLERLRVDYARAARWNDLPL